MQVRWVDQTQYPMIVVASLSAVPQSCRTPLPNQYLDCMLLAVYTHTHMASQYERRISKKHSKALFIDTTASKIVRVGPSKDYEENDGLNIYSHQ